MNREKSSSSRNGKRSDERQRRCDPLVVRASSPVSGSATIKGTKPTSSKAMERDLSPLEMFRMNFDGEGPEDEAQSTADAQEDEFNSSTPSTPTVGDSPVYIAHDGYGMSESYEETSLNNQTQTIAALDSTRQREAKLNSKFRFKQRCKMVVSLRKTRGLEDMSAISKETFFKNHQCLMNLSNSTSKINNSRREASHSPDSPSLVQAESEEYPKTLSLPKTRRRPTVMRCLAPFDEKSRKSTDSVKETKASAKSRTMPQMEVPVQLQRSVSHNFESQEMSSSSIGTNCFKMEHPKRKSSCKNFLKKFISLTTPAPDITSFYDTSSQDDISPKSSDRASSPSTNSTRSNSAQRMSPSGRHSKDKRKSCGVAKEKASLSPSERSRNGRSMGRTSCKDKNDGSRSARTEEEAIGANAHQGFTAFVPFQGFAAFSTHGGAAHRSSRTPARCCS